MEEEVQRALGRIEGKLDVVLPIVTDTAQRVGHLEIDVADLKALKPRRRSPAIWFKEAGLLIGGILGGFFAGKQGG
jgi:hypothetical protein